MTKQLMNNRTVCVVCWPKFAKQFKSVLHLLWHNVFSAPREIITFLVSIWGTGCGPRTSCSQAWSLGGPSVTPFFTFVIYSLHSRTIDLMGLTWLDPVYLLLWYQMSNALHCKCDYCWLLINWDTGYRSYGEINNPLPSFSWVIIGEQTSQRRATEIEL